MKMIHLRIVTATFLTGFLSLISGGVAWGAAVTVGNFSFEDNSLASGGYTVNSFASSYWVYSGAALPSQTAYFGAYNPTALQFASGPTNGANTAFLNTGSLTQTLATTLLNNTQYTLSVDVGDRADTALGSFAVQLLAGSNVIGTALGVTPSNGSFSTYTVSYFAGAADPFFGLALGIQLVGNNAYASGYQVNFDNVRLDAVTAPIPEPEIYAMMGLGLGLIGWVRRTKKLREGAAA